MAQMLTLAALAANPDCLHMIDVRDAEDFSSAHVTGAVHIPHIPLAELEQHLDRLKSDREVVAYCRGPHCVLAFDAVARLRQEGIRAQRLDGGLPEWRLQGLPVE